VPRKPKGPEFFVTFGQRYRQETHPVFPPAHPDGWLRVVGAADITQAREAAFKTLGSQWSNIYADELHPETFPLGELGRLRANSLELRPTPREPERVAALLDQVRKSQDAVREYDRGRAKVFDQFRAAVQDAAAAGASVAKIAEALGQRGRARVYDLIYGRL